MIVKCLRFFRGSLFLFDGEFVYKPEQGERADGEDGVPEDTHPLEEADKRLLHELG